MAVDLPVIIAGAGPCGLLAALILQRHGMPFVVLERAPKARHTADVGSGYDIAPTAQEIFRRLEISEEGWCTPFRGTVLMDVGGSVLRRLTTAPSTGPVMKASTRSALQARLLAALGPDADLRFGVAVTAFAQITEGVIVTLDDGGTVAGRALLGCDGIHSAVRHCMYRVNPPPNIQPSLSVQPDNLRFCGFEVWWGKCPLEPNSQVQRTVDEVQGKAEGRVFVWCLGNASQPGCFMGSVLPSADATHSGTVFAWSYSRRADLLPSGHSEDYTRRGAQMGPAVKTELEALTKGLAPLIVSVVGASDPAHIYKVTVHQRGRLDLPYVLGRVALLGDAAHPQCPYLGQGLNMALTDAYVCAERLATQPVETALLKYDTQTRRDAVNKVIERAHWMGEMLVSDSRFTSYALQSLARWGPVLKWLLEDPIKIDECNRTALEDVTRDLSLSYLES